MPASLRCQSNREYSGETEHVKRKAGVHADGVRASTDPHGEFRFMARPAL